MIWHRTNRPSTRRHRSAASRGQNFRFGVERLEDRRVLANVAATLQLGVLTLTAQDGAFDDVIKISPDLSVPGHLHLVGTGTTINGVGDLDVRGVTSIVCRLKGGNDHVEFNANIPGSLTFNGGSGTNKLDFDSFSQVGGSVRYVNGTTSANDDTLEILASHVLIGHDVIANFGAGTSFTQLGFGLVIGGKVSITAGSGVDEVDTQTLTVGGSFTANLGGGANVVSLESDTDNIFSSGEFTIIGGALKIATRSGADSIDIGSEQTVYVLGNVSIKTGDELSGGDTIKIDNSTFYSNVFIDLGAGSDLALLDTVNTLNASLDIGGLLTVLGRAGNDVVAFGQDSGARLVDTSVSPKLDGGGGTDSLLVITLYINDMLVDNVNDFSPLPVSFENISI
jgi:hypothetical protein